MEKKPKCKYCGAPLSSTNSVFIHINRYDKRGKSSTMQIMCCMCWDNTQITVPFEEGGYFNDKSNDQGS